MENTPDGSSKAPLGELEVEEDKTPEPLTESTMQRLKSWVTSVPASSVSFIPQRLHFVNWLYGKAQDKTAIPEDPNSSFLNTSTLASVIDYIPRLSTFINYTRSFPSKLVNPLPNVFASQPKDEKSLLLPDIGYADFLKKLKSSEGSKLQEEIQSFIDEFAAEQDSLSEEGQGKKVHMFIEHLQTTVAPTLWSDSEMDRIGECLEKYLMEQLYSRVFAHTKEQVLKDVALYNRIAALYFVNTVHLDIPSEYIHELLWHEAQEELLNLNSFKAPRDKLCCILNCCKKIFDALKIACGPEKIPGVDEFVPIFIYTILKANPPCLHSNIEYLSHFRHPSRMLSESGYYFVSFLTAVSFIESLDASMLSIDAEEFENLLSGKTKPAPENEGLDLEPDDSSLSEWVWIKKKGPSVYISEKKLFSHLFIRAREERKRSLFDLRASTSFLWSRQSNDIKKLIDKKPEELSFDEIRLLQQECKRLLALQEKSKK